MGRGVRTAPYLCPGDHGMMDTDRTTNEEKTPVALECPEVKHDPQEGAMLDSFYPTESRTAECRPVWLARAFYRDGQVSAIGPPAAGAYICAAFDCLRNHTGGFIPESEHAPALAAILVRAELWRPVAGGYRMPEDGPLRLERPDDDQYFDAVMPIFGDY